MSTETLGSLTNRLAATVQGLVPTVGMGATRYGWSDRAPYTVIEVSPSGVVTLQADHAHRTDANGMSECQGYLFSPNPEGEVIRVRWSAKLKMWKAAGRHGAKFTLGKRSKYHDYSF